jgi:ribosomal protein L16/L10AE
MSTGNLYTPPYVPRETSRGTHATKYVKQCHGECTFPRFIIHRERSYWYMSVIVCVDHSVSTRRTHTRKQRGWGAVGSSMARLNKGRASSQFSISAYACSHSLAVLVMTVVHSSVC